MRRALSRGNRDFHTTLQCGLPGLVSPQHSSFVIVLELTALLLRRCTSFLAQVVTLTGPREPGRNCQTPRPPPLGFPSLDPPAAHEVTMPPIPVFASHMESICSIHSSVPVVFPFPFPSSKVASHSKKKQSQKLKSKSESKIQNPKAKSKKRRWSAKSLKESLEP